MKKKNVDKSLHLISWTYIFGVTNDYIFPFYFTENPKADRGTNSHGKCHKKTVFYLPVGGGVVLEVGGAGEVVLGAGSGLADTP